MLFINAFLCESVLKTAEGATTPETLRQMEHKKLIIWREMFYTSTEGVSHIWSIFQVP